LPPAVVIVAEHDPVRDDGERWVGALQNAGVQAAGVRVLTHLHGTWVLPGTLTSEVVRDLRVSALRRAFGSGVRGGDEIG
jgi:acetyl esterase